MTIISRDIKLAVRILRRGGIVAYPTESSYAMGCDATNPAAVRKIYALKKRPKKKQITVIVGSMKAAERHALLSREDRNVVRKLMPGRLTLVCRSRNGGEFAFRIPLHKTAFALARRFSKPITATSANISGKRPIHSTASLLKLYGGVIDMVLDGGTLPGNRASTVASMMNGIEIRRKGPVTKKQIEGAL
ncbi:MAG: threonylcarbamoyl-AMP synthase [Candidatus Aenigmarchaeota archaeon]|nr:threonylcarbamoyl-AMP synthase [Candidatus Aenigmarchaeota archaeon]